MQQQIALITLGVHDLRISKRFYVEGFGWNPILEDEDTVLYQMNGFILSTWLKKSLSKDMAMKPEKLVTGKTLTLAHSVPSISDVGPTLERLHNYGGKIIRKASQPPHGGMRGYIADPDNHIWEIIWNPMWQIQKNGSVTLFPKG